MLLNDLTLFSLSFALLLLSIITNATNALHLLLTAELLWITLFGLTLILGIVNNNLNLLALTFFFLVLSAIEFGTGLVLMLIQNIVLRSISLVDATSNKTKFANRFKIVTYVNRTLWKF